ncbi:hypothetical protein Pve01_77280 [Planomonospora venezuelensis]|nr:hypothetical protein Pve01_77280 [Planomonospora venezuelensis]
MSASRLGRRFSLATAVTGLLAAPLAVVTTAAPAQAAPVDIQILATNDFHGRLLPNTSNGAQEAGAAQLAGAVKQLESDYPGSTAFTAAGDLIGASTFESFIQRDKPTLDALNIAGLDVSAAGNHEFDQGYDDLVDRVMTPYDATTNPEGGADWQYIAANVKQAGDHSAYALPDVTANTPDPSDVSDGGTWMTTMNGVKVGFVGAVTEDLPALVSPSGITDVYVDDIVSTVNQGAADLKADGADIVVMLIHEGASSEDISALSDGSAFAQIVAGVDSDVSAIVSGHTHLAYNHADPNADTAGRPVVSAGQYGTNLNKLVFAVDPDAGTVALKSKDVVRANTVTLTAPSATAARDAASTVVQDAVAKAEVLGARELGQLAMPFNRAKLANGNENRGGESTLGNLVAEVQRWATGPESSGTAQIAFMNPGGLRADMLGNNASGYPAVLTYKQAAVVQPFANTLVTMDMTGAQIKTLLEQQWQRDGSGNVPSRPFLRLGTSEGFEFTYDATRPEGDRITGMWLDGTAIVPGTVYSVTANSFLASGGDNFRAFNTATNKRDSGRVDLQAMVDALDARGGILGLPLIKNVKHLDPADRSTPEVIQIETAMGAAIEVFEGALTIEVGRDRFVPVKTTDDLLVLRSDVYDLGRDFVLDQAGDEVPFVSLDGDFYKLVGDFDKRFPEGAPSLREAESFTVAGDWTFGPGVRVVGGVALEASSAQRVEAGAVLSEDPAQDTDG